MFFKKPSLIFFCNYSEHLDHIPGLGYINKVKIRFGDVEAKLRTVARCTKTTASFPACAVTGVI
jgi:hypothetical protein